METNQIKEDKAQLATHEVISILKELIATFRFERYLYCIATLLSFIFLLICALVLLISDKDNVFYIVGMFGSTGVMGIACSQFLKMWNQSLKFVSKHYGKR